MSNDVFWFFNFRLPDTFCSDWISIRDTSELALSQSPDISSQPDLTIEPSQSGRPDTNRIIPVSPGFPIPEKSRVG
jgi:hypothetical protein